ncbi:hypothetical protein IRY34_005060 [Salmonella enterica]|nr:hypothetical protein [Salmonella enterica]EGM8340396.1 hypothetical protein [Salmonella enterica]
MRHTMAMRERFIPAGAGNTQQYAVVLEVNAVYPRWRGEHASTALEA